MQALKQIVSKKHFRCFRKLRISFLKIKSRLLWRGVREMRFVLLMNELSERDLKYLHLRIKLWHLMEYQVQVNYSQAQSIDGVKCYQSLYYEGQLVHREALKLEEEYADETQPDSEYVFLRVPDLSTGLLNIVFGEKTKVMNLLQERNL